MQKFLVIFAVLGLVFVLGAVAEEEFDSFSVTVVRGDTPWGQWESYESTKVVPWESWLDQFATINQVVPNEERSFRHLPVGEWLLPIYRQQPVEMTTEVLAVTADEAVVVTEETDIPEETTFMVVSQTLTEVALEEAQAQLAVAERKLGTMKAQNASLQGELENSSSARDAEVVKLQTLLASKEEALKVALKEAQATTVVVDKVWGLTPKQVLGGALAVIGLVIVGAGAMVWHFRKNATASHSSIARELTRVAGEREAVCKQLKEAWGEKKELETLVGRLNKTNLELSELSEPAKMLYKFQLPPGWVTKKGLVSHVYLPILRQPGPDQEMRVLLLGDNGNGHLTAGEACKVSAVERKLLADPEKYGLFVAAANNGKSHKLAEHVAA